MPSFTSGTLFTAQLVGVTTTPVPISTATWFSSRDGQLTTFRNVREIMIQADAANTTNVMVGVATAQFIQLTPGQAITLPVTSPQIVYVAAKSGTVTVDMLARE